MIFKPSHQARTLVLLALFIFKSSIAIAEFNDETIVCHKNETTETYRVLFVSTPHKQHHLMLYPSDAEIGATVPNFPDYLFSHNCVPVKSGVQNSEPLKACYDDSVNEGVFDNLDPTDSIPHLEDAVSLGHIGTDDLEYKGPLDTVNNVIFYWTSRNGTCSGQHYSDGSVLVQAKDRREAEIKCTAIIPEPQISSAKNYHLVDSPTTALASYWICSPKIIPDEGA